MKVNWIQFVFNVRVTRRLGKLPIKLTNFTRVTSQQSLLISMYLVSSGNLVYGDILRKMYLSCFLFLFNFISVTAGPLLQKIQSKTPPHNRYIAANFAFYDLSGWNVDIIPHIAHECGYNTICIVFDKHAYRLVHGIPALKFNFVFTSKLVYFFNRHVRKNYGCYVYCVYVCIFVSQISNQWYN